MIYIILNKFNYLSEKREPKTSILVVEYDDFIRKFTASLKDILSMPTSIQNRMASLKFEELMIYISEIKGFDFLDTLDIYRDTYVVNFKNTIESNKLNKLTIKELAFLCNMSISSFKRQFQKHYQQPPISWFQNQRLEYAAYLITKEKKKSSEIYTLIGFQNHSNFIKAFKAKFGVTPKNLN